MKRSRGLVLALGLSCSVLVIGIAELTARLTVGDARRQSFLRKVGHVSTSTLEEISALPDRPDLSIRVRLPPPQFADRQERYSIRPYSFHEDHYRIVDRQAGYVHRPNMQAHAVKKFDDKNVIYDVTYQIDEFGRRRTPAQDDLSRQGNILLFGSSSVFGHGLGQDQTMSAHLAKFAPRYRVFNYGNDLWGTNNVLRFVRNRDISAQLPPAEDNTVIFWMTFVNMERLFPSLKLYRSYRDLPKRLPYFFIDQQGQLADEGMMSDQVPQDFFFRSLARSALLAALPVEYPADLGLPQLRLSVELMKAVRTELSKKIKLKRFVIAFDHLHHQDWTQGLAPLFRASGFETVDYNGVDVTNFIEAPSMLLDGHPSSAALEFWMRQLTGDLQL